MSSIPLLIQDLTHSYSYDTPPILNGVNIELNAGEILGLVGLNGIGKTTMIKSILGLLNPTGGEIRIAGKDNKTPYARSLFTYLPEKFAPSPNLRGREFLELTLSFYDQKYKSQEAAAMCASLDLDPAALNKYIKSYSKGMGQKLGLAAVFLTGVPVLILDEPMSGLDPKARVALKTKIKEYIQENKQRSIFFSSHIMADIEEICDRIVVLHSGAIRYSGDVPSFVEQYGGHDLEHGLLELIAQYTAANG